MNLVPTSIGTLAVSMIGEGRPLFLLPAAGRAAADFDAIRPVLAVGHRTIAVDWPAMGDSPPPPHPEAITADAIAGSLDELVTEPSILLGHSVGGYAAARFAVRRPDLVRALILVNSGGFVRPNLLARAFCRWKGRPSVARRFEGRFARWHTRVRNAEADAMVARVEAARGGDPYARTLAAVWRSFADPDVVVPAGVRAPTLLLWGARDPVIPVVAARAAERQIQGARLHLLDSGHTPFLEAREPFLAALLPFLAGLA